MAKSNIVDWKTITNFVVDSFVGYGIPREDAEICADVLLESDKRAPMMDALKKASGFIRRELSHRMMLRYTPELLFELDTNIEYAAHINELLKQEERHDDQP